MRLTNSGHSLNLTEADSPFLKIRFTLHLSFMSAFDPRKINMTGKKTRFTQPSRWSGIEGIRWYLKKSQEMPIVTTQMPDLAQRI